MCACWQNLRCGIAGVSQFGWNSEWLWACRAAPSVLIWTSVYAYEQRDGFREQPPRPVANGIAHGAFVYRCTRRGVRHPAKTQRNRMFWDQPLLRLSCIADLRHRTG